MKNVASYIKPIRDYLAATYGVLDPEFDTSGRHTRLRFEYAGRRVNMTLNDRNAGDGCNLAAMKLQDIRRVLGTPPELPKPCTARRRLEDMLPAAPLAPTSIEGSAQVEPESATPPNSTVALYSSNNCLTFRLPAELVGEFSQGASHRGVRVDFTAPDLWSVRHTEADRPAIREDAAGPILQLGGAQTRERLGAFRSTPAVATLEGGVLRVRLAEPPNKQPSARKSKTREATLLVSDQVAAPPPVPTPSSEEVAAAEEFFSQPVPDETTRLRALLAEVRAVEADTPYRLVRLKGTDDEPGRWAWRAVLTVE